MNLTRLNYKHAAATLGVAAVCVFASCSDGNQTVDSVTDRAKTPSLRALDVHTVISDSGVTRYRMNAGEWLVYDKAEEPYWDFPKGIHLEKFTPQLDIDAELRSKYAIYYDRKKFWELHDSVHAKNLNGEQFECKSLFWDETQELVFSDDTITIKQANKTIVGKGFKSNQSLTKYEIRNVMGVFPVSE
ncbi:MAG: LPS export ABC transporter periplasmic protein LptC [Paludibacteraceae bacterium]|nr:LPS export ABC transporter periplasmic protein LptC [Paludibacteraceae bacterium]